MDLIISQIFGGFPEVLSSEELYYYFEKFKSGDMNAREILIVHNIKLVVYIVNNKFYNPSYDVNDLISIGIMGLIKAVDTYDHLKKFSFSAYAGRCISNEIISALRHDSKPVDSLDENVEGDTDLKIVDVIVDDSINIEESYENKESIEILYDLLYDLPLRDKKIMELAFGFNLAKPMSQAEVGKALGISQSVVSKTIKKNLIKLKVRMNNYKVNNNLKRCRTI